MRQPAGVGQSRFPPSRNDRRDHFACFFDDRTYRCLLFATQLLAGVHLLRKGHNPICTWRYGLSNIVSCIIKTCLSKVDFGGCSPATLMIQGYFESLILSCHHDLSRKKTTPTRIHQVWLDIDLPSLFSCPVPVWNTKKALDYESPSRYPGKGRLLNDFEQVPSITIPFTDSRLSFTDQGGNTMGLVITNLEKLVATRTLLNTPALLKLCVIARPTIHIRPSKSAQYS